MRGSGSPDGIGEDDLRRLPLDLQRKVIAGWFLERFEDPAVRTPYDSESGGYVWLW